MMSQINVIYITTLYEIGDGTSEALNKQVEYDSDNYNDYIVIAKKILSHEKSLNIVTTKEIKKIIDFANKDNLIINYFKSRTSNILMDILEIVGYKVPVITTVCQSPSYPNLWLTPYEIKKTWHFVFIDKTAYNNKIISFIPRNLKTQIYLAKKKIENYNFKKKLDNKNKVVFGRGSSSLKCPKNMFDVFDKIDVPNKLFRIVGIENDSWIFKEAAKRNNVEVYGKLPRDKWIEMCNSFDVFLYQIPEDSFSSIDATIGLAMNLGKPVVYMGSEAPKERFHNNENGFVANSVEEMAYFATILGNDPVLRTTIGERGRISSINDFRYEIRTSKYKYLYENTRKKFNINIPLKYIVLFFLKNRKQSKQYIRGLLRIKFKKTYALYIKLFRNEQY